MISQIYGGLGRAPSYVLREIPGWCSYVPFSDYTAACKPYSDEELQRQARSDAEYAANSPSAPPMTDEEKRAYIERSVTESNEAQAKAERSDPLGACVRRAALEHTFISRILGPGTYCNPDGTPSGFDADKYLMMGGVLVVGLIALVLFKR